MANNGVSLTAEEFKKLPQKEQMTVLFHNTECIKACIGSYKFQQKIQWVGLTVAFAAITFLIKLHIV